MVVRLKLLLDAQRTGERTTIRSRAAKMLTEALARRLRIYVDIMIVYGMSRLGRCRC